MAKKKELPYSSQKPGQPEQVTQFYHKGMAGFAANLFEKDCREMEADGWRLVFASPIGQAGALGTSESIVAIYQR